MVIHIWTEPSTSKSTKGPEDKELGCREDTGIFGCPGLTLLLGSGAPFGTLNPVHGEEGKAL